MMIDDGDDEDELALTCALWPLAGCSNHLVKSSVTNENARKMSGLGNKLIFVLTVFAHLYLVCDVFNLLKVEISYTNCSTW